MRNVDDVADEIGESAFDALPERVQEALGELAGAANEAAASAERWCGARGAE